MATLPRLFPTGDGTATTMAAPVGAATYWQAVDDLVGGGSHDSATTYITGGLDSAGSVFLLLTDMPTDFQSLDSLSVSAIVSLFGTITDDTTQLFAQAFAADETTALSAEVLVCDQTTGAAYTVDSTTLTGLTNTTNKTLWDGARLRLRWAFVKNMASDAIALRVTAVYLDGTYTAAAALTPVSTARATTWVARRSESTARATTWTARRSESTARASTWAVRDTMPVSTARASTWAVTAPAVSTTVARFGLTAQVPATRTAHSLTVRARSPQGGGVLTFALYEGETQRASFTQALTGTLATYTGALTDPQAQAITAGAYPSGLELRLSATGTSPLTVEVASFAFDAPAAAAVTPVSTGRSSTWTVTGSPADAYGAAVWADSPVGYWRLGDASGSSTAVDARGTQSGTYRDGATNGRGPVAIAGPVVGAASFDGSNDNVLVTYNAVHALTGAITVEAWVKPTSFAAIGQILSRGRNNDGFRARIGTDGKTWMLVADAGSASVLTSTATAAIPLDSAWHHVAITYDPTTGQVTHYLDGQPNGTTSHTAGWVTETNTNPTNIGVAHETSFSEPYSGGMAEVAIYPTALTATRVLAHYSAAGGLTPVSTARATTWVARAAVSAARSSTWVARAAVTTARSSTWVARAAVSAARASTWTARAARSTARATTWTARAALTVARSSTWAALTSQTTGRATTWTARLGVLTARSTTWAVVGEVTAVSTARSATWAVEQQITPVSTARASTWTVRSVQSTARTSTWAVLTPVSTLQTSTWAALTPAATARPATWTVRASAASSRTSTWAVYSSTETARPTSWSVTERVTAARPATWQTLQALATARAATWAAQAGVVSPWERVARTSTPRTTPAGSSLAVVLVIGGSAPRPVLVGAATPRAAEFGTSSAREKPAGASVRILAPVGASSPALTPSGASTPLTTDPGA